VIQNYHTLTPEERRFWEGIMVARSGRHLDRNVKFIRNETMVNQHVESYFTIEGYTVEDYLTLN
jgi:hypothetical protein